MPKQPFPVDPALTAIAVAYRNAQLIADDVCPRADAPSEEFKYWEYPIAETFGVVDDHVGRRGRPNEIRLSATEKTDSTDDHGLEDAIPQKDIDKAPPGHNPVDRSTLQLADYIAINREIRVANLYFDAANYAAGMKVQLAGNDQWSAYGEEDSDPVEDIKAALDAPLMRPNIAIFGNATWSKLSSHPKIIKSVTGTLADSGIASRRQVADLFELEEIYVGQGRFNVAAPGQAAVLSRVWGKHAAFHYRNRLADLRSGITFALTAQWGGRIAGQWEDKNIGLRGGQRLRVGESVKEVIIAAQAGYFIEDAVG